ncbi:MAG: tyrosine-type recombinase/integrase [Spirochaetaceae bacterium]|nr:tyrosine-type recombinase/integrase [Spirochaetaceae bacterium]
MVNNETAAELMEEYRIYLRAVRRISGRTLLAYGKDLENFALYCAQQGTDPLAAESADVQGFITELGGRGMASVSVNRVLSSIRGFYRWLLRYGRLSRDPTESLRNLKTPTILPVFLWEREMADFAELPDTARILWPSRDKAIILVMYSAGLRISETAALTLDALEGDLGGARVIGKGNKERYVFFSGEAQEALRLWIPARNMRIKAAGSGGGPPTDKLFINRKGGPISIPGLRWIITKYAEKSGLQKNIHPHALRHSFATHLVNSGCDVRVVQELLGHASLSTTQRYTHVDIEGLKRVHSEAHPHGSRPRR